MRPWKIISAALPLLLALGFQPVLACVYAKGSLQAANTGSEPGPALGIERYAEKIHTRARVCQLDTP